MNGKLKEYINRFNDQRRNICYVHRQIYSLLGMIQNDKDREQIEILLCEAYQMGKRMNKKLREYKKNYSEEMFEKLK